MKRMIKLVLVVVALSVFFGSIDARADQLKWTRRVDPSWVEGDPYDPDITVPQRPEGVVDTDSNARPTTTQWPVPRVLSWWLVALRGITWTIR
ncbi:MAG: hypothetical protein R3B81_14755 [bacterium]